MAERNALLGTRRPLAPKKCVGHLGDSKAVITTAYCSRPSRSLAHGVMYPNSRPLVREVEGLACFLILAPHSLTVHEKNL